MLLCHWVMTTAICILYVPSSGNACAACFTVVFSFWTVNYIALELEMPFGDDPNDLPLLDMQKDFNASLICLLQPHLNRPPSYKYKSEHANLMLRDTNLSAYVEAKLEPDRVDALNSLLPVDTAQRRKS